MAHDPDYVMPFGKYKGRTIEQIPSSYLRWVEESMDEIDQPDIVANAMGEYAWRSDHGEHFEDD